MSEGAVRCEVCCVRSQDTIYCILLIERRSGCHVCNIQVEERVFSSTDTVQYSTVQYYAYTTTVELYDPVVQVQNESKQ